MQTAEFLTFKKFATFVLQLWSVLQLMLKRGQLNCSTGFHSYKMPMNQPASQPVYTLNTLNQWLTVTIGELPICNQNGIFHVCERRLSTSILMDIIINRNQSHHINVYLKVVEARFRRYAARIKPYIATTH